MANFFVSKLKSSHTGAVCQMAAPVKYFYRTTMILNIEADETGISFHFF